MATIGTRIWTWLKGEPVGEDSFGNRYYREKGGKKDSSIGFGRERRWVIYAGAPEGSAVPPRWNAWLHHAAADVPSDDAPTRKWEQPHEANPSGTSDAYLPPGHTLKGGTRAPAASGDYEPWSPA